MFNTLVTLVVIVATCLAPAQCQLGSNNAGVTAAPSAHSVAWSGISLSEVDAIHDSIYDKTRVFQQQPDGAVKVVTSGDNGTTTEEALTPNGSEPMFVSARPRAAMGTPNVWYLAVRDVHGAVRTLEYPRGESWMDVRLTAAVPPVPVYVDSSGAYLASVDTYGRLTLSTLDGARLATCAGVFREAPVVVATTYGNMMVFQMDGASNLVYFVVNASPGSSNLECGSVKYLGRRVVSMPTISRFHHGFVLAVRAAYGNILTISYDFNTNSFSQWKTLNAVTAHRPAVMATSTERYDVYFVSSSGNLCTVRVSPGDRSDTQEIGGKLLSAPVAVASESSFADVFGVSEGNQVERYEVNDLVGA